MPECHDIFLKNFNIYVSNADKIENALEIKVKRS